MSTSSGRLGRRVLSHVLHRHGDRAPMCDALQSQAQADLWAGRLPGADRLSVLSEGCPVASEAEQVPEDLAGAPYGCLTTRGLGQLEDLGRRLVAEGDVASRESVHRVRASNFDRTQRSVQSLLVGVAAAAADGAANGNATATGAAPPADLRIRVPPQAECPIDRWGASEELRVLTSTMAAECPRFVDKEASLAPVRAALIDSIPYFRENPSR
jgi:hypothetical protein